VTAIVRAKAAQSEGKGDHPCAALVVAVDDHRVAPVVAEGPASIKTAHVPTAPIPLGSANAIEANPVTNVSQALAARRPRIK